jgi:hypothetical protein
MTLKLEVLVNPKDLINGWSEVYAGADGQPRYRSNSGLVGTGTRITRVIDTAENHAPVAANISITGNI